jgi:hypothetical protein
VPGDVRERQLCTCLHGMTALSPSLSLSECESPLLSSLSLPTISIDLSLSLSPTSTSSSRSLYFQLQVKADAEWINRGSTGSNSFVMSRCLSVLSLLAAMATVAVVLLPSAFCLSLPSILSSNMVLQRSPQSAQLWGSASAGNVVTVTLDGAQSLQTMAQQDGSWSLQLPAQAASVDRNLTIAGDGQTLQLSNVAFGEVFLCAGQSNMQVGRGGSRDRTAAADRRQRVLPPSDVAAVCCALSASCSSRPT